VSTHPATVTFEHDTEPRSRALEWSVAHRYSLAVWSSMVVWSGALMAIVRSNYLEFRLARYDLGNMVQTVWNTAHGHPLEVTNGATGEQMVRLGSHVDPVLALFTPLWLVWPSPLLLAFAQIAIVSLGALPVFWLARRHLGSERLSCLLALAYLAYPWLAWTTVDSMHPITLAIPLVLFALWFLDDDRLLPFVLVAVVAVSCRSLVGLTIAGLGVWYALARGKRKEGLAIAGLGFGWFVIANAIVKPAFSDGHSNYWIVYGTVGGSPRGLLSTALTHPETIASMLVRGTALLYLALLAAPLAGLFLLAPALAAAAVPQLVVNGLADGAATTDPRQHYIATIIPVLFGATVLGIARVRSERRGPAAVLVLSLCVATSAAFGPWPGAPAQAPLWYQAKVPAKRVLALRRAIALVPDGAPVSTTDKAGSHVSARRYVSSVPIVGRATWIVLDTSDPWLVDPSHPYLRRRPKALRAFTRRLETSTRWKRVFAEAGVLVFRRTVATTSAAG
jgi:uncharacterized membrane protein